MSTATVTALPRSVLRDKGIEDWLDTYGVVYEFETSLSPTEDFDIDRSLRNQARVGANPVDSETVERYRAALAAGAKFPPLVASRTTRGKKLTVVDGNHRLIMYRDAKHKVPAVYVVKGGPQVITALTFDANTRHGLPTSEAERMEQAIWLVNSGSSAELAATRLFLPVNKIRAELLKREADRRAEEVGLGTVEWQSLPAPVRSKLQGVGTDEGFRAAAKLAISARLGPSQIADMCATLASTKSGQRQVQLVAGLKDVYAQQIEENLGGALGGHKGGRKHTPKTILSLALSNIDRLPTAIRPMREFYSDAEREEQAERLYAAAARLNKIADILGR